MERKSDVSLPKFIFAFLLASILIPIVVIWGWMPISADVNYEVRHVAEQLILMLWPSSVMFLGGADNERFWTIMFFSTLTNSILYTLIGAVVWFGLYKYRILLFVVVVAISAFWWKLLSL